MGIVYPDMAATAQRLLTQNGVAATLRIRSLGAYDPITDTSVDQVTDYPVHVVLVRLNQGVDDQDIAALGATYTSGKATKAFIAGADLPEGVAPAIGSTLVLPVGDLWTIWGINPIRPSTLPLVHICVCVQGPLP